MRFVLSYTNRKKRFSQLSQPWDFFIFLFLFFFFFLHHKLFLSFLSGFSYLLASSTLSLSMPRFDFKNSNWISLESIWKGIKRTIFLRDESPQFLRLNHNKMLYCQFCIWELKILKIGNFIPGRSRDKFEKYEPTEIATAVYWTFHPDGKCAGQGSISHLISHEHTSPYTFRRRISYKFTNLQSSFLSYEEAKRMLYREITRKDFSMYCPLLPWISFY